MTLNFPYVYSTNELWVYDIRAQQWTECKAVDDIKPLPRYGAFMVCEMFEFRMSYPL